VPFSTPAERESAREQQRRDQQLGSAVGATARALSVIAAGRAGSGIVEGHGTVYVAEIKPSRT
jgi:hypothetical protein